MMKVEILVIGNEILIGKTQDTNSHWLAKRITKLGHQITRITAIGDELNEISNTLKELLARKPQIIITSGGLGPTFDDMTLKGVAKALNRELEMDKNAYHAIEKAYDAAFKKGILKLEGMTLERKKMAYLPKGAIPLPNTVGTAPGVKIIEGDTTIFCVQGVPSELKATFRNAIFPYLSEKKGKFLEKGFVFMGIGESQMAPYVSRLEEEFPQLWIKTHPKIGLSVEVELSITAFNLENGEELIDRVISRLKNTIRELQGKIKE